MSIRDVVEGDSLIQAIERDFPELSGWWEALAESEFQRCDICNKINLDDVSKYITYSDGISRGLEHHKSWEDMKKSAIWGCHLCKLFYFAKLGSDKQSRKPPGLPSGGPIYIHLSGSSLEVGTSFMDCIRFWVAMGKDSLQQELDNEEQYKPITTRFVEDNPASSEAFSRVQHWIDHCTANHPHCVVNENVPLPTRVLDIHESTGADVVKLLISDGQCSKYTALSHCWGDSSRNNDEIIRTCTMESYEELKAGISILRLPKTFQDAITVTRNLGIRYLWIDSLCIKQDYREDWSRESAKMSEVYGNSFITVLASTARNSSNGFLHHRDPKRCISTRLCRNPKTPQKWTWIRWPLSEGEWDQSDRVIQYRAWAFQEYSLPPRVLEYAPTQLEWHCNQIQYDEKIMCLSAYETHDTYKELMWILSLPNITKPPTKDEIPVHPYFAAGTKTISIYRRWYDLVEGYSARDLTFETDRLPAIAGLAAKIQHITGDFYMAGLWKKDLGAGLCWKVRGYGDLRRPSKYIAPSWSWASLEGSITHSLPEGQKFSANLLDFHIRTDGINPFGEVSSGSILLSGHIRKLRISQETVSIEHIELDYNVHHWTKRLVSNGKQDKRLLDHNYALRDQDDVDDPRGTGFCTVCFDIDAPANVEFVILLQLLAERANLIPKDVDDNFETHGIVLQKSEDGNNQYRRIGAYSIMDAEAPFISPGSEHACLRGWKEEVLTII